MSSKKLSGNGLWESSRMMLPQHREALAQRRKESPPSAKRPPTFEELALIKNFAALPIVLAVAEENLRKMELAAYPLKKLYVAVTKILIDRVIRDMMETKKLLRGQGIKVYEDEKTDGVLRIKFNCRGYEDDIAITRDAVKAEIAVKLQKYTEEIYSPLIKA